MENSNKPNFPDEEFAEEDMDFMDMEADADDNLEYLHDTDVSEDDGGHRHLPDDWQDFDYGSTTESYWD